MVARVRGISLLTVFLFVSILGVSTALGESKSPSGPLPQWNADGTRSPGQGDDREVLVIDEGFSVKRGEHVVIEDKIIRMIAKSDKNSTIRINGVLEIKNSVILWEQKYNQQVELEVAKGGELSVVNSYGFASGPAWWNWGYADGASVKLDRAHIDVWTTAMGQVNYKSTNFSITRLTLREEVRNSQVLIEDSVQTDLELFTPQGSKIDMSVPAHGSNEDWKLSDFYPKTTIDLKRSRIGRIDLTLTNNSDVTLRDYVDGQIGLAIDAGQGKRKVCSIDGFGDPKTMSGIKVSKKTWDIDCNNSSVTFIDSKVVGFWFAMWGNMDLDVTNSRLIDPTNAGCGARLTIRDSGVDLLRTRSGDCGKANAGRTFVANSHIMQGVDASGKGARVWLFNTSLGGAGPKQAHLTQIEGGKISKIESDKRPW